MSNCRLENCTFAKDGRCLEGLGENCPNLLSEASKPITPTIAPVSSRKNEPLQPSFELLPGTAPLDLAEARILARRGTCKVVTLVGPKECGKTSLLARLHQLFQSGPILEYSFAGSHSLPRLEELNWNATVDSGNASPIMDRSPHRYDNSFVHLSVRSRETGMRTEILFNDISGETFQKAVATQSICGSLIGIARADHLVILVDGEALASPTHSRHHHIGQTRDFLQRVLQSKQCGATTALHIVISKQDKLRGSEHVADTMKTDLESVFKIKFGQMIFWRIAARPTDGSLPTTHEIQNLFTSWVKTSYRYPELKLPNTPRHGRSRDFCRYGCESC